MTDQDDLDDAHHLRAICASRSPDCDRAYLAIDRRYRRSFSSFFRRFRRSTADVEDLCQTTFLKVIERACQFAGAGKAAAWLWTIARNTLYDSPREQPQPASFSDTDPGDSDPLPDPHWDPAVIERRDLADRALEILHRYDPRLHDAVWLRVVLGEDYDALGPMLRISERYARQLVSDCMKVVDVIVLELEAGRAPDRILADLRAQGKSRAGALS